LSICWSTTFTLKKASIATRKYLNLWLTIQHLPCIYIIWIQMLVKKHIDLLLSNLKRLRFNINNIVFNRVWKLKEKESTRVGISVNIYSTFGSLLLPKADYSWLILKPRCKWWFFLCFWQKIQNSLEYHIKISYHHLTGPNYSYSFAVMHDGILNIQKENRWILFLK